MSTPNSQFEVVSTIGSSASDNDDSSRAAMYHKLVQNPTLFWDTLKDFFESCGNLFEIPTLDGYSLNLHKLFIEVTSRGGIGKVIKDRKCKEVIDAFNFEKPIRNASCVLRKHYLKLLFQFEQVYYLAPPSTLLGKELQELELGDIVIGIIEGEFEGGYLTTVKRPGLGDLKGVMYIIPEAPPKPQRHKKKKAKTSPKLPRSAYDFFFTEQHAWFKDEFGGNRDFFTEEIGNMWSNLPESCRQSYEEKSLEDTMRYDMELLQYNSSMDSCAAALMQRTL
ncbi:putative high mobility group B protein 11 [Capsella rubella]|uniref:putative high mobility group B protein 11 n=1 Tax=Capsella rubella TaxID=81985 RepID=UPI000CD4AD1C|nr:putative high mobility group B protein 11 [Capsella rubella]